MACYCRCARIFILFKIKLLKLLNLSNTIIYMSCYMCHILNDVSYVEIAVLQLLSQIS